MCSRYTLTIAVLVGALLSAAGCTAQRAPGVSRPAGTTAFRETAKLVTENYKVTMKLVTENYEVTIMMNREEGDVTCEDVVYHGVSRKSGKGVTIKGSTYHTYGADGTPSRFLGYRFEEGDVQYVVLEEGRLLTTRGDSEVLVDEAGCGGSRRGADGRTEREVGYSPSAACSIVMGRGGFRFEAPSRCPCWGRGAPSTCRARRPTHQCPTHTVAGYDFPVGFWAQVRGRGARGPTGNACGEGAMYARNGCWRAGPD